MSDAACDWPWATCLELQSDPQFMAAFEEPGCVWKGPSCAPRLAFTSSGLSGRSAKVPRHPEITSAYLHLPAAYLAQSLKVPLLVLEWHEVGSQ